MSDNFTFLPWARQGLANRIVATGASRASIPVQLRLDVRQLDGADVTQDLPRIDVQLYGPGDVIGLESRAILRTEPRDWITNFEPNYLAAIEFYDEDMPWRYSPVTPDADGRLTPWIALVVLKEKDEFDEGIPAPTRPLPYITVKNDAQQNAFPVPNHLWAWAHVHVNRSLTANAEEVVSTDVEAVATQLGAAVAEDADLAYSRIVCPRRLEANTSYHAFLIPTFESGRLAGLGLDPTQTPAGDANAWTSNGAEQDNFPVYYRWHFKTGAIGDFEYLVRLLQYKPVDKRVGVRDLDVQHPGSNVPGLTDPNLHGVLQLGGALRVPRERLNASERTIVERQENWARPGPHPFQRELASLINLADAYTTEPAAQANLATPVAVHPDPVIGPPLYGRWHARTPRLLTNRNGNPLPNANNWVHELNLDPRFRVAAGFGTRVVQSKQEDLMAAAWDQVGDVIEANRWMRRFKFGQQVSFVWYQSDLQPLAAASAARGLTLTAPVHSRITTTLDNRQLTMKSVVASSKVTAALVGPTMRRLTRPGGRLIRALQFDGEVRPEDILVRVNNGEVVTAPPKETPPGIVTVDEVASGALPSGVPNWLIALLRAAPWLVYVPLLLALIIALICWLLGCGLSVAATIIAIGVILTLILLVIMRRIRNADALREENQTPEAVDDIPNSSDFTFTDPDDPITSVTTTSNGADSAESQRFKEALKDLGRLIEASEAADNVGENGPPRQKLDLENDVQTVFDGIDPAITIPGRAAGVIRIPPRILAELPEVFVEAMAHPVFNMPMYRPLADLSSELLIPNLNLIENNSVTLLETNQKFIESYMVGLNHEFARELLWREYPTDQRGSYFRQFWDVSSFFAGAAANDETLRDRLRDIPPLDKWSRESDLGDHDARERPGDNQEEVVLVIRGELLKRYPNAVIYAQRAEWVRTNGDIDREERTLVELDANEEANPPREKLRTPLYTAKVEPDIYFLGFDLTVADVRGGTGQNNNDPAGWFFVIKERPGEPRFGFDESSQRDVVVWNDLGWDQVPRSGNFIQPVPGVDPQIRIPANVPAGETEKEDQRKDDVHVLWDNDVGAAELAYILYQAPVMVAVHGAELLQG